jgi:hypothetical protein
LNIKRACQRKLDSASTGISSSSELYFSGDIHYGIWPLKGKVGQAWNTRRYTHSIKAIYHLFSLTLFTQTTAVHLMKTTHEWTANIFLCHSVIFLWISLMIWSKYWLI